MSEVVHLVLARWSPSADAELREEARAVARSLATRIPGILQLDEGPSISPEGLEQGYDYGLTVRFVDAAARDAYLPHPAHLELVRLFESGLDAVAVFDIAAR